MSQTFLWLAASTVVFMAANSVLKLHATGGSLGLLAGALVLFCIGNTKIVQVMRSEGLGVAITPLAVFVFGERLALLQWIGIALAVIAVMLIAFPQGVEK